jgi:peptide/nickel transport system permease protein
MRRFRDAPRTGTGHGVGPAIARAFCRSAALLLVASLVVFGATAALGADAVTVRAAGGATPGELARLRIEAGLDRPLPVRYADWLTGLLTGDPGRSLVSGRPVGELVAQRATTSATLVVAALVVALPLVGALVWAATRARPIVRAPVTATIVVAAAVPQVVVTVALAGLLSSAWGLVPPVSLLPPTAAAWSQPRLLVLPVLSLALPTAAYAAGLLRGAVADVTAQPYVRDAELRGIPPAVVLARYIGPAVAPVALRVLAVSTGSLVAGAALVETLVGVAGLGELFVGAVAARDVPVVQAVSLLAAAVVVLGLLVADVTGATLDPRRGQS